MQYFSGANRPVSVVPRLAFAKCGGERLRFSELVESTCCHPPKRTKTMITKRTLFFLLAVSLATVTAQGQFAVSQSPSVNADCIFSLNNLPRLCPNTHFKQDPFYGVFCLFGNGEYAPAMDPTKNFCWDNYQSSTVPALCVNTCPPQCTSTCSTSFNYNYPAPLGLAYRPFAIPLPRKGDDPPPAAYSLQYLTPPNNITVSQSSAHPAPRISNMPPGKQIYFAHSHGYLNGHLNATTPGTESSVFIISYKDKDIACIGNNPAAVHLFYGCKRPGGPTETRHVVSQHFGIPTSHIPVYLSGPTPVTVTTLAPNAQFYNHDKFILPSNYISNVKSAIGNSAEQRLFQQVEFADPNELSTGEWSYAMAVLTSASTECACPPASVKSLLNGLEGFNGANCTLDSQYVVDVDTIYLKSGEPDDPNRLVIAKVCTDGSIRLKLNFCNSPTATGNAPNIKIEFRILDPNIFEWCRMAELRYPGNPRFKPCGLFCFGMPPAGTARYNCAHHSIAINAPLGSGDCASVEVVLRPKQASLRGNTLLQYLQNTPILEATVWFENTPLTVENERLDSDSAEEAECSTLCEPLCITMKYPLVGIFIAAAASILLGWALLRRR